jgi:hypothetical protein
MSFADCGFATYYDAEINMEAHDAQLLAAQHK